MDPITHYMFAYALGRKRRLSKTKLQALTFSALLPDIDVFTVVLGWDFVVEFHGTVTHSISIAVLLSLILSVFFYIHYKKNLVVYGIIGVSMHLLIDMIMTFMPEWRGKGMMLLFPFSMEKFALRNMVPYSLVIGVLVISSLFIFSIFLFFRYVRKKEYPWRIWINEKRIFAALRNNKRDN